jgi:hypothetical protein
LRDITRRTDICIRSEHAVTLQTFESEVKTVEKYVFREPAMTTKWTKSNCHQHIYYVDRLKRNTISDTVTICQWPSDYRARTTQSETMVDPSNRSNTHFRGILPRAPRFGAFQRCHFNLRISHETQRWKVEITCQSGQWRAHELTLKAFQRDWGMWIFWKYSELIDSIAEMKLSGSEQTNANLSQQVPLCKITTQD